MNQTTEVGVKDYKKKLRWSLIPMKTLEGCIRVLMYGATTKYALDNWKKVKPQGVYLDAVYRHLSDYLDGEEFDLETSESHLSHILCDVLFLEYNRMHRDREVSFEDYLKTVLTYEDYTKSVSQDKIDKLYSESRQFGEKA